MMVHAWTAQLFTISGEKAKKQNSPEFLANTVLEVSFFVINFNMQQISIMDICAKSM